MARWVFIGHRASVVNDPEEVMSIPASEVFPREPLVLIPVENVHEAHRRIWPCFTSPSTHDQPRNITSQPFHHHESTHVLHNATKAHPSPEVRVPPRGATGLLHQCVQHPDVAGERECGEERCGLWGKLSSVLFNWRCLHGSYWHGARS